MKCKYCNNEAQLNRYNCCSRCKTDRILGKHLLWDKRFKRDILIYQMESGLKVIADKNRAIFIKNSEQNN